MSDPDMSTSISSAWPAGYVEWLNQLKKDIARARQRAASAVNSELVGLYARIGREILFRQETQGWGARVIDRLARDLKDAFPDMRGWSSSNLKYMRFLPSNALMAELVSSLLTNCRGFTSSPC